MQKDGILPLLHLRSQWVSHRAKVITQNISRADMEGVHRRDLAPFARILKNRRFSQEPHGIPSLQLGSRDIVTTANPIARDVESLEMAYNAQEHDTCINMIRSCHKMLRAALTVAS